ncbi:MAG TPA: penicillin-binding protein 2 [Phycicoccus sp.]|nr:penicillin-binding protein 2 [Phycicoccus sp.]
MNAPIRRLSTFVALLFGMLLVSTTWIQFVSAKDLNAREDNRRTLLSSYAQQRGQILVGNQAVAESTPTDDEFKYIRNYANGPAYAHVTGYYSFYGANGGLESVENSLLSGRSDKLFYRRVSDLFTGRKAQGANLQLTINPAVQQAAIDGLGSQRGAAVALDPKTGAILAMVSNPSYDPNALASHDLKAVQTAYKALDEDTTRPLVNRAIGGNLYPPGSTFKIVTAASALSTGKFTPDSKIPGPAVLDLPQTTAGLATDDKQPCGPNDQTTLADAVRTSCNSAFGWLGMELGADQLRSQAAKFGFGDQLTVPMRVTPSSVPAQLNPPQLAQSAIGQYDVRVTPLQVAMIAAGVANRGTVMKPYLVQSVLAPDLSTIDSAKPQELSQAVTPQVATQLTAMMEEAVNNGTGGAAKIPGVRVAGKTGTAQHAAGAAPHAWFMTFAPADDPKIAIAVVVEDGGQLGNEAFGGTVAAPIARAMIEAALR